MDINELRSRKIEVENEITKTLIALELLSGCKVTDIKLVSFTEGSGSPGKIAGVRLGIKV